LALEAYFSKLDKEYVDISHECSPLEKQKRPVLKEAKLYDDVSFSDMVKCSMTHKILFDFCLSDIACWLDLISPVEFVSAINLNMETDFS
jgi:hypothetical protein